jgi:uncharacterized protein (TIGR02594 family)
VAEPVIPANALNNDAAAIAESRRQFNAQRGLAFKPDAQEAPSPFDFSSKPLTPSLLSFEAAHYSSLPILLSPELQNIVNQSAAPLDQQAVKAGNQAVTAGVTQSPAPQTAPAPTSAGALDNAITVLAAMTNQSSDAVRAAITDPTTKIVSTDRVREFMTANKAVIEQSQKPENIAKLPQAQRDAMRQFLQSMGYPIDEKAYGGNANQQAQALSQGFSDAQKDLGLDPASMMMMLMLGAIAEALGLSGAFQSVLGMMGGANTFGMRTGTGGMGTSRPGVAKFSSEPELERIAAGIQGKGTLAGVVNLANGLVGQHEVGNNGGAIVRATMGYTGDPWCGGFVRYTFEKAGVTGVYDQGDYRMAQSYMRIGQQHGAFRGPRSGYNPQPGDVIVFSSSRGPGSGHVGIVTKNENGQITYVSGNDNDQVQPRTFSLNNPPGNTLGYTDTKSLARAKGKNLDLNLDQVAQTNTPASAKGQRTRDH